MNSGQRRLKIKVPARELMEVPYSHNRKRAIPTVAGTAPHYLGKAPNQLGQAAASSAGIRLSIRLMLLSEIRWA